MKRAWSEGVVECPEFDLGLTLESGQTFHWIPLDGGYTGCIGSVPLFLRQENNRLYYRSSEAVDLPSLISHYFAFDHDLEAIRASCASHPSSRTAMEACRGLRVMRQPHWEAIASFILSPMKQVAHIRQMSLALRSSFGIKLPGTPVASFPTPKRLASLSEEDLRSCGLGFRAKGLLGTARLIASREFDPEDLVSLDTEEARGALCQLPGVGRKVANCILLFGYERLNAVPVDVWIGRILESFRSSKTDKEADREADKEDKKAKEPTPLQLENYGERVLGPYAGYVQQCLFHQARTGKLLLETTSAKQRASSPLNRKKLGKRPGRLTAA